MTAVGFFILSIWVMLWHMYEPKKDTHYELFMFLALFFGFTLFYLGVTIKLWEVMP